MDTVEEHVKRRCKKALPVYTAQVTDNSNNMTGIWLGKYQFQFMLARWLTENSTPDSSVSSLKVRTMQRTTALSII